MGLGSGVQGLGFSLGSRIGVQGLGQGLMAGTYHSESLQVTRILNVFRFEGPIQPASRK